MAVRTWVVGMGIFEWEPGTAHFKPSRMEARIEREADKARVRDGEDRNKAAARRRDGWMCRFPRCVCHRPQLRLHPEVAHVVSKGMGGDHGTRSAVAGLICLCPPRHRESRISLHRGTLKVEALTDRGMNGPVCWLANVAVLDEPFSSKEQWVVVARESQPRVLEPLTKEQGALLERIAELAA